MQLHPYYDNAFYLTGHEVQRASEYRIRPVKHIALGMGLNPQTLHKKLDGTYPFTLEQFALYCSFAGTTPREVLTGDDGEVLRHGTRELKGYSKLKAGYREFLTE